MRLERLRLVNFRQHADTDITFGEGITGIIGPNGSGKTTLLEAITWAFYGSPAVRGHRETIRFNRAPPRSAVRVEVEFGLGGHDHRVVRTLYGAELYVDRAESPVATGGQEVTRQVQRLLGMEREEFFNTYFTGQKELAVMATLGPADRGRFLSRLLGYERLRLAQSHLREARNALRGELQGLEQGLADSETLAREVAEAQERCAEAERALAEAAEARDAALRRREAEGPAWTAMTRLREQVLALDGDRRVAESRVQEARREFERLDRELAEALGAQGQVRELEPRVADVPRLKAELQRLEQEGRAAGRRRELLGQVRVKREREQLLHARAEGASAAAAALDAAAGDLEAARRAVAEREAELQRVRMAWVRDRQDAETKRDQLRAQYKTLQEDRRRIVATGADGACPTCMRPLGEGYDTVVAALDRQLEEIEINGKFYAQRVEQLDTPPEGLTAAEAGLAEARTAAEQATERHANARQRTQETRSAREEHARTREEIAALEAEIAALPDAYDVDRHDAVRDLLGEREPALQQLAALRVKAERAEALVQEAETADHDLTAREAALAALERQIAALDFSDERYAAARTAYEAAQAAVQDAEIGWGTRGADVRAAQAARGAVERRVEERARRETQVERVRTDLRVHEELDDAFGDLRSELNAQLRPELSELASGFLAELTEGRYHELELDEQYRIILLEEGETRPVISGGEEDVANLVLRLAISQMVAERAGQPLSLLVLDEIFGSLDEIRRANVVALLRRLADRFPQVVLITHIESVRESVDRVLQVHVDPASGAARVVEAPDGMGDAAA